MDSSASVMPPAPTISCPSCGHDISMFEEVDADRQERFAGRVADLVASFWYPAFIAVGAIVWIVVNVIGRPFDPYPMVMIGGLGVALAMITAFHGPLILLAQRHAAARDRLRDIETYRVATNSERDLHRINQRLTELEQQRPGESGLSG
jgi:uncharacterized membrane protein